eukprot:COSAG02_NODE_36266_length_457_cov_0.567039_1_plen_87_part_00
MIVATKWFHLHQVVLNKSFCCSMLIGLQFGSSAALLQLQVDLLHESSQFIPAFGCKVNIVGKLKAFALLVALPTTFLDDEAVEICC